MGWRNITFTCLDDATKAIDEARAVLKKHGTGEDLLLALLAAQSAINHAITEAVSDGIPRLCIPIGEDTSDLQDHDCGVGGGLCPECIVTRRLAQALDVASDLAAEAHGRRLIRKQKGEPPCVVETCTPETPCNWRLCPNAAARDAKRAADE